MQSRRPVAMHSRGRQAGPTAAPHLGAVVAPLLRALLAVGASRVLSVPATASAAPGHPRAAISCTNSRPAVRVPRHTAAGHTVRKGTSSSACRAPRASSFCSTGQLAG
jgi:hypothetical protein